MSNSPGCDNPCKHIVHMLEQEWVSRSKNGELFLRVHNGKRGHSEIPITHCPLCGTEVSLSS